MKTNNLIQILVILLLCLSSCREISVLTKINKDGSFTRVITITGDSSEVINSDLPYPIDDSWEKQIKRDTTDQNDYILTYTKSYSNSDLLNEELLQDTGWRKQIQREIVIRKKFWFFSSYVDYRETWHAANPFAAIDHRDFLSNEDLQWLSGYRIAADEIDSARIDEAEGKAEKFLQEALAMEIIGELKNGIEKLNLPGLNPVTVDLYHDSIMDRIGTWNFQSASEFIDYYAEWIGDEQALKLHTTDPQLFMNTDKNIRLIEKVFMMETHQVSVEMPGLITGTNSPSINGNLVSWKVSGVSFLFEDYEMTAESRIMNTWAYILAGAVLLLLLVLLIVKSMKRGGAQTGDIPPEAGHER